MRFWAVSLLVSGHSPQGECGLKSVRFNMWFRVVPSLPARGVWIEIHLYRLSCVKSPVTPRKGSVD